MKRRRKSRGLGAVNPDANAAIRAARAGRCKSAMKHLYDASPHVQSHQPTETHRRDYKIASTIVTQLCVRETPSRRAGKYKGKGFDGRRRSRR